MSPASAVRDWYLGLGTELREQSYTIAEWKMLHDTVNYYGRFLTPRTRAYALNAVSRHIGAALEYLRPDGAPRILDLGCGLGMQSLLFAMRGATVVGLDCNPDCIALCRKRQSYWESRLGRPLPLRFEWGMFPQWASTRRGRQFDGVFSYSALAWMRPMRDTLDQVSRLLNPAGRVFLWDRNFGRFGRRKEGLEPDPTPRAIASYLESRGLAVSRLAGAVCVPWPVWCVPPLRPLCRLVDRVAPLGWAGSFTLAARKA